MLGDQIGLKSLQRSNTSKGIVDRVTYAVDQDRGILKFHGLLSRRPQFPARVQCEGSRRISNIFMAIRASTKGGSDSMGTDKERGGHQRAVARLRLVCRRGGVCHAVKRRQGEGNGRQG